MSFKFQRPICPRKRLSVVDTGKGVEKDKLAAALLFTRARIALASRLGCRMIFYFHADTLAKVKFVVKLRCLAVVASDVLDLVLGLADRHDCEERLRRAEALDLVALASVHEIPLFSIAHAA